MTTVEFRARKGGGYTGFEVSGHAGYAESGQDIVCAEVSALTQATLNGLKNVLKAPVMFDIDPERAYLCVFLTPEATESQRRDAQILLETLFQALQAVERDFPRFVRVITRERRQ